MVMPIVEPSRTSELIIPHEFQDEAQGYADLAARGQRVDAEGVRQRKDQLNS